MNKWIAMISTVFLLTSTVTYASDPALTTDAAMQPLGSSIDAVGTGLNSWIKSTRGLSESFRVSALISRGGRAYAGINAPETDSSGLFKWSGGAWVRVAEPPSKYGIGLLQVGADQEIYMASNKRLYRLDETEGKWETLADPKMSIDNLYGAGNSLYATAQESRNAVVVKQYDMAADAWKTLPSDGLPRDRHGIQSLAVTQDGSLYVSFADAYREKTGGAVYRWNGRAWADFTDGLDLASGTGSEAGSCGGLAVSADGSKLYVSTEQGIYLSSSGGKWEKYAENWGNRGMLAAGGFLFAYSSHAGVERYAGTKKASLGQRSADSHSFSSLQHLVSPDGGRTLFASDGRGETDGIYRLQADERLPATESNLDVETATYLGGAGDDAAQAVEMAPGGEVVVAGNFSAGIGSVEQASVPDAAGATSGAVVRLSADGKRVLAVTRLGNRVDDMEINRKTGTIAVAGDFGVAVLDAAGRHVLWSQKLAQGGPARVAMAEDGRVASLQNKVVTVWSAGGQKLAEQLLDRSDAEDVAFHSPSGLVYVVGYDNKRADGRPVQVAFLQALDADTLAARWQDFGYDARLLKDNMADTRGYRIAVGGDNMLYFLGESAGGNSIYRWNGRDLSTSRLVSYDAYNDPAHAGSARMLYYAKLDPQSGELLQGQFAIPRPSETESNAFRAENGAIAADEQGTVYVGGKSAYKMAGRDLNRISGTKVGSYAGGDMALLVASADFKQRLLWTTFTGDGGTGTVSGIAVGSGKAAVVGTSENGALITKDALSPAPFAPSETARDAYLAVWKVEH